MNQEIIAKLQNDVINMEQTIKDIQRSLQGIEIDHQLQLKKNVKISPGIASKIAYDSNGLIINGENLKASDIPLLQIDGIEGLRKMLEGKINLKDFDSKTIKSIDQIKKKIGPIVGTGTKVNYDANGNIVSSSELIIDDIPELPIKHVSGLKEELDIIKASIDPVNTDNSFTGIIPGTFPMISYDASGKVLSGCKLIVDDIPMELITRINLIESKFPMLASQITVESLMNELRLKIESNQEIIPGTYTKVTVDSKGLITGGNVLSVKDLPELQISDIHKLSMALINKADQSDIIALNNTVSGLVTSISKIGDVVNIQNILKTKAEDSDVKNITVKIDSLQRLMDTLSIKIPNELILEQLQQIQNDISTMFGRITVLEKKMGIETSFNTSN